MTKALTIATDAHRNQKRNNGEPYINHPIRVAQIAVQKAKILLPIYFGSYLHKTEFLENIESIALLHDVLEDTDVTSGKLHELFVDQNVIETVCMLTRAKTKTYTENYFEFISKIANSDCDRIIDTMAIIVKLADLEDNMSDLNEGSLKDKYRFAYAMLSRALDQKLS